MSLNRIFVSLFAIAVFPIHLAWSAGISAPPPTRPEIQIVTPPVTDTQAPLPSVGSPQGILDTSFGNGGKVQFNAWTAHHIQANAAIFQPFKKYVNPERILIVGSVKSVAGDNNSKDFFIMAVHASGGFAGQLDTSFGPEETAGTIWIDFNHMEDEANAITILPDGSIIVAGYSKSGSGQKNMAFVALDPRNGEQIRGWGASGKTSITVSSSLLYNNVSHHTEVNTMIPLADNSLIAAGNAVPVENPQGKNRINLVKLTSNGSIDATFGNTGMQKTLDVINLENPNLVASDNGFYLGSTILNSSSNKQLHVFKYLSSGQIDNSGVWPFATAIVPFSSSESMSALLAQENKLVLVGKTLDEMAVARIQTGNGSLDSSFGVNGKNVFSWGVSSPIVPKKAAVLRDGSFFVASVFDSHFGLMQINPNATALVSGFGTQGKLSTSFNSSTLDTPSAVIPVGDTVYVVGTSLISNIKSISIARYLPVFAETPVEPACGDNVCNGTETHETCASDCGPGELPAFTVTINQPQADLSSSSRNQALNVTTNRGAACGYSLDGGAVNEIAHEASGNTLHVAMMNSLSVGSHTVTVRCAEIMHASNATASRQFTITEVSTGTCGDGTCGTGETASSCPSDCDVIVDPVLPRCGDAICNGTESNSTCPGDCPRTGGNPNPPTGSSGGGCSLDASASYSLIHWLYGVLMLAALGFRRMKK